MDNEAYKKTVQKNELRGLTIMNTYQRMKKLVEETKIDLILIKRSMETIKKTEEWGDYAKFTNLQLTELYELYEIK